MNLDWTERHVDLGRNTRSGRSHLIQPGSRVCRSMGETRRVGKSYRIRGQRLRGKEIKRMERHWVGSKGSRSLTIDKELGGDTLSHCDCIHWRDLYIQLLPTCNKNGHGGSPSKTRRQMRVRAEAPPSYGHLPFSKMATSVLLEGNRSGPLL